MQNLHVDLYSVRLWFKGDSLNASLNPPASYVKLR